MTRETSPDSHATKVQVSAAAVRSVRSMQPRYAVVRETASSSPGWWLERDGRQLLAGPAVVLDQFCDLLNLLDPPERSLPQVLRALMQMARGNVFVPGEALRRIGRRDAA